jgi:hypothetical protein
MRPSAKARPGKLFSTELRVVGRDWQVKRAGQDADVCDTQPVTIV